MSRVDNLIILGNFNCQTNEPVMKDFCDTYSLKNLIIYKHFDSDVFRNVLKQELQKIGILNITYDIFDSTFMENLSIYAPMKMKYIRANNAPFMTKLLSKAIMNRSRLNNRFNKDPCTENEYKYKKTTKLLYRSSKEREKIL